MGCVSSSFAFFLDQTVSLRSRYARITPLFANTFISEKNPKYAKANL